mmetsp:Transcript_106622/g.268031  ORF Transcript_106622/g.268031 Transcript_106622/m.268031 type:complete len:80 (+) Transcript_106622:1343-1582(+)
MHESAAACNPAEEGVNLHFEPLNGKGPGVGDWALHEPRAGAVPEVVDWWVVNSVMLLRHQHSRGCNSNDVVTGCSGFQA